MKQVFVFSLIYFFSLFCMTCFAGESAALHTLSSGRGVLNTDFKNFAPIQETDVSPSSFNNGCSGSFRLTGGLPEMDDQAWYQVVISKIDEPDIKGVLLNTTRPKNNDLIEFFVPVPGEYRIWVQDDDGNRYQFFMDMGPCQAVEFEIGSGNVLPGDTICLDVRVKNFLDVLSFQGALNWDTSYLNFIEVSALTSNLPSFEIQRNINSGEGYLSWYWFNPEFVGASLEDNEVLFQLCFEAVGNIGEETLLSFEGNFFEIVDGSNSEELGFELTRGKVQFSAEPLFVDYLIKEERCFFSRDGEVELVASGGTPPLFATLRTIQGSRLLKDTIVISGGEDIALFSSLGAGIYEITVADSEPSPNITIDTIVLASRPSVGLGIRSELPRCSGETSGIVFAEFFVNGQQVIDPGDEYTFRWNVTNENTTILYDVPSGMYSVTVTDSRGCEASATTTMADPPALNLNANIRNTSCQGMADGSIEFTVSGGTAPYTIFADEFSGAIGPSTPFLVEGLSEGTYEVRLRDANGCERERSYLVRNQKTVNLNAIIAPEVCTGRENGQIYITASSNNPDPPFSFEWASDASTDLPAQNTDFTSRLRNLSSGTYYLTVSDQAVPACILVDTFTVEPAIQITVDTMINANCVCNGYAIFSAENLNDSTDVLDLSWQGNGREGTDDFLYSLCPGTYVLEATSTIYNCTERDTLIINDQRINCCDRRRDSLALVTLYNATNGPNWVNPWMLTQPMTSWPGVFLNANGCVVHLDLDGTPDKRQSSNTTNGLKGIIPEEIGEMLDLEILNLSQNRGLSGGIPASIGDLLNLQVFDMLNDSLTDPIPEEIGNLNKLWYFSVNNNFIKGQIPQSLGMLKNLRFLFLNDNKELSGPIPETLTTLENLEVLRLDGNKFTENVPDFSNQPLRVLRVENNDLDGLPDLSSITTWATDIGSGFLIYDNQFTFEDILPNMNPGDIVPWIYAPQDSIFTDTLITRAPGESLTIDLGIDKDITTSIYNWFKDGQPYTTRNDNQLTFNNLQLSDSGVYSVEVTNPGAPDLTLYGRPITLNIAEDTIRFAIPDTTIQAGQEFCLPVRVENFLPLRGLQFSINYDSTLLEFTEVRNFALPGEIGNSFGAPDTRGIKGDIVFAWTHPQQQTTDLPDGTTLFELCFRSLGLGSTSVALSGSPAVVEVIDGNINLLPYSLKSGLVVMEEDCRMRDSLALVEFYNATGGSNWINNENWLSQAPIDTWYGIQLNPQGCVEWIDLDGNNLSGSIPTSIGELRELKQLTLSNNNLRGRIPSEVGKLTGLTALWLDNNELTGSIPFEIGQLGMLEYLILYANQLTGEIPKEIGSLTNLQSLWLNQNRLSGSIPTQFGNLEKLVQLVLSNNQLSSSIPSELGQMSELEYLYLHKNQLSGEMPKGLGQLSKIRFIYLHNNGLSGSIPPSLTQLSELESLVLSFNNLTGTIPDGFVGLDQRMILLDNNQLEGCFPDSFAEFCNLDFNRSDFSDSLQYFSGRVTFGGGYNFINNPSLSWNGDFERWCNGEEQVGALCDDENPTTQNDNISSECLCVGEILQNRNVCLVTNTNDDGPGSLRSAIMCANETPGADSIHFEIEGEGPYIINVLSELPHFIDEKTVVDGTTQPQWEQGYIQVNGYNVPDEPDGLVIDGNNIEIYGLFITGFNYGIRVLGRNCVVGQANKANVISGNGRDLISGANIFLESDSKNGIIQHCIIGPDPTGLDTVDNKVFGIIVKADSVRILNNLISGNSIGGISIQTGSFSNRVPSQIWIGENLIGTNLNGSNSLPDQGNGIYISRGEEITIFENLISGNGEDGLKIESGGFTGVRISNVIVRNNKIGTDISGQAAIPNSRFGVLIGEGSGYVVEGNLISGNENSGLVYCEPDEGEVVIIQDNKIGTDLSGQFPVPNLKNGIETCVILRDPIDGPVKYEIKNFIIGGKRPNTIAFNSEAGIKLNEYIEVNIGHNNIFCNGDKGIFYREGIENIKSAPEILFADRESISGRAESGDTVHVYLQTQNCPDCQEDKPQAETYLGSVQANQEGDWEFNPIQQLQFGKYITTTASDIVGRSSEFSACYLIIQDESCRTQDSLALVEFYDATGGAGWFVKWDFSRPIDTWQGVSLNEEGCVDSLKVFMNNLSGTLNDLNLPFLKYFDCGNNNISGVIPDFSNLPSLNYFSCYGNNLSGSIPDFMNLPELEVMNCQNNNLSGPIPDFTNLARLKFFYCQNNDLTGGIPNFSNSPNLEVLWCNSNQLSGPIPDFSSTPKLAQLWCFDNNLSGSIPDFSNLSELWFLDCKQNSLSGSIPDFSSLPKLSRFNASDNELSGSLPTFSACPNIFLLHLNDNFLEGCFPENYFDRICGLGFSTSSLDDSYNFINNPGLPWGGDLERWCNGENQYGAICDDSDPTTQNEFITRNCECGLEEMTNRPTGITPNGDGFNDRFIIPELRDNPEQYPNNELVIFNRWGDVVFQAQPYNNDWDGRDMNTGQPLPAESYYYIIRLDLGNQKLRDGVITIIR